MARRHQVGVQLGVQHADARICRVGGGAAEVLTQIIGNALLPKVGKAH